MGTSSREIRARLPKFLLRSGLCKCKRRAFQMEIHKGRRFPPQTSHHAGQPNHLWKRFQETWRRLHCYCQHPQVQKVLWFQNDCWFQSQETRIFRIRIQVNFFLLLGKETIITITLSSCKTKWFSSEEWKTEFRKLFPLPISTKSYLTLGKKINKLRYNV